MSNSKKTTFTEDDMTDMAFQSELFHEVTKASAAINIQIAELVMAQGQPGLRSLEKATFSSIADQLAPAKNRALNIGHLTRFLTLFNENSAAARILSKEY
mgnify:CR=1 FL=1